MRLNDLQDFTVFLGESGAQGFMPGDDRVQRGLQNGDIQHSVKLERAGVVIGHRSPLQLIDEPDALLRIRSWGARRLTACGTRVLANLFSRVSTGVLQE